MFNATTILGAIWILGATCLLQTGCGGTNTANHDFKPGNEQQRAIVAHIESFIRAHEQWELEAYEKWHGEKGNVDGNQLTPGGAEVLDAAGHSFVAQLQGFFVAGAPIRMSSIGKPLQHESQLEHVSSIDVRTDEFLVRTTMKRKIGSIEMTDYYEYVVVFEDGLPKIRSFMWQPGE